MMDLLAHPCADSTEVIRAFNTIVNAAQMVLIAWLTNRAVRKDREEVKKNGHKSEH
jgi:hypothetical protein